MGPGRESQTAGHLVTQGFPGHYASSGSAGKVLIRVVSGMVRVKSAPNAAAG
jgi:hypothetical protein